MFGVRDLKPHIDISPNTVECPVLGCSERVARQRRSFRREERFRCSEHKIYISPSTFEYDYEINNLLWKNETDLALLNAAKTVKRESRITRDNSEDAVTWNVFRYLEATNQVAKLLSLITQTEQHQAELIYWSYSPKDHGAWPELNKARKEFGENLQRSSEPDLIAVTDKGLFFIEVKLTAPNDTTPSDSNNRKKYLIGGDEWFRQVFISDYETIAIKSKLYELFRFWLLGSWVASRTGRDFYLINIVLSEREKDVEQRFNPHIRKGINRQFKRVAWEEIHGFIDDNAPENDDKSVILEYFRNKTIGYNHFGELQKAFAVE
jgi:hypothetical protein